MTSVAPADNAGTAVFARESLGRKGAALGRYLLIAFGLYHLYRVLPFVPIRNARIAAGFLVVFILWCIVVSMRSAGGPSPKLAKIGPLWLAISAFYCIPVLTSGRPIYLVWVLTDITIVLLPLLVLYAGHRIPGLFDDRRGLLAFGGLLLMASVVAGVAGGIGVGRFHPPSVALIAGVWLMSLLEPRLRARVALFGLSALLLLFTLESGGRAVTIAWVVAGLVSLYMAGYGRQALFLAVTGVSMIWALGAFGIVSIDYSSLFQESEFNSLRRIDRFSEGGVRDQSLTARIDEAKDVLHSLNEGGFFTAVVGHGHGATFRPTSHLSGRNISDDGLAHSIHIGPALALYRYGVFGLALYGALVFWTIGRVRAARWRLDRVKRFDTGALFALGLLLYMFIFTVQNSSADPTFAYVLAGALWHWDVRQDSASTMLRRRPKVTTQFPA